MCWPWAISDSDIDSSLALSTATAKALAIYYRQRRAYIYIPVVHLVGAHTGRIADVILRRLEQELVTPPLPVRTLRNRLQTPEKQGKNKSDRIGDGYIPTSPVGTAR